MRGRSFTIEVIPTNLLRRYDFKTPTVGLEPTTTRLRALRSAD